MKAFKRWLNGPPASSFADTACVDEPSELLELPEKILRKIILLCDKESHLHLRQTCKQIYHEINRNDLLKRYWLRAGKGKKFIRNYLSLLWDFPMPRLIMDSSSPPSLLNDCLQVWWKGLDLTRISHEMVQNEWAAIVAMNSLEKLYLPPFIDNLQGLGNLVQLEQLTVEGGTLSEISPLASLTKLRVLRLGGCLNLTDFNSLKGLVSLVALSLSTTNVRNTSFATEMTQLRGLDLSRTPLLEDVRSIVHLPVLAQLNLCTSGIVDISPLAEMKQLKQLDISSTNIENFDALADMELESLDVSGTGFKNSHLKALANGRIANTLRRINVEETFVNSHEAFEGFKVLTQKHHSIPDKGSPNCSNTS